MHPFLLYAGRFALLVLTFSSYAHPKDLDTSMIGPTIAFELRSDFLVVVNGEVEGLAGLKFIVDTGSTHTVIDRKIANKLRLPRHPGKVSTFDRDTPAEWADINDLRAGPIRASSASVMVMRLAEYSELAKNVDGIIGLDLLSRGKKLTIDYERRALSFELGKNGAGENLPAGAFAVPIVVQGLRMHLLVDTGCQGMLLYRNRLRNRLPSLSIVGESRTGVIGRLGATQVNLPGVKIGGPEKMATVLLIDGPKHGDLLGVDGYLGPASLHAKRIEFDFATRTLRWVLEP